MLLVVSRRVAAPNVIPQAGSWQHGRATEVSVQLEQVRIEVRVDEQVGRETAKHFEVIFVDDWKRWESWEGYVVERNAAEAVRRSSGRRDSPVLVRHEGGPAAGLNLHVIPKQEEEIGVMLEHGIRSQRPPDGADVAGR